MKPPVVGGREVVTPEAKAEALARAEAERHAKWAKDYEAAQAQAKAEQEARIMDDGEPLPPELLANPFIQSLMQ